MVNITNLTLTLAVFLLSVLTSRVYTAEIWTGAEKQDKRSETTESGCRSFLHKSNAMMIRSEVVRKIGNGATPEICKRACLEATDFTCAAAQIQLPATCYIAGYKPRNDYHSTHFKRVCDHGPTCFEQEIGTSGGFTESESIPSYFHVSPQLQALYCMARCEQIAACVGFDLRREAASPQCVFLDLGIYKDYTFDLYLRRC